MAGEVSNIEDVANVISKDIFSVFRWEKISVENLNFLCEKKDLHFAEQVKKSKQAQFDKTHPVDVVFRYFDPYLNKHILLNTDLKCYATSSISALKIQTALESLAKTIDCASVSKEWKGRYNLDDKPVEIRGLMFLYNHDNKFHKEIQGIFNQVKLEKINIKNNQIIHLIDPVRIRYLNTVIADMRYLQSIKELPINDFNFSYPDLILHKIHSDNGNRDKYPATIETLCSPFMVIEHERVTYYDETTKELSTKGEGGYVIYYNQRGESEYEFMYLLDYLSRLQILIGKKSIKIRMAHHELFADFKSVFARSKNLYLNIWGSDISRKNDLERIEIEAVKSVVPHYNPGTMAWRD